MKALHNTFSSGTLESILNLYFGTLKGNTGLGQTALVL